ncbi:hypothetical protein TWF225_008147 [Orbilia oligospora]|uniref:Uncharacterized protein n=1 Tax=Orbilia oligospora TaxID=2813651 RepID=A0A7C8PFW9_ORBOL|nr:hypothetical protein TWF751_002955 [Orbilia oligospora]KAF3193956.1 hypothetical protein TWF225_008147 [Orbilia oligospora]KAF3261369.1 hypothetical protein TWF128_003138 [Orbilia oligospora]KAF3261370.1 hypothetical protein TWF128_003138 [Orbilia oligospora]KAF3268854.1 hypothetical protein TWF217_010150 [Orbilia oligospora]
MELGSVCVSLAGVLATVGAKLYCLAQEMNYAEGCLGDLSDNVKSTEVQLSTIQDYLSRAGLSSAQKSRCEYHLRDTEVRINKFVSSMEAIVTKMNAKSMKKMKQKLKLVNGELDGLRYQIDKIDRNLSAIRQELMIGIALDERQERRATTAQVVEKLDVIEANTTGTDARKLRKKYKVYAQELMMDDYIVPPPYTPGSSTSTPASVNARSPVPSINSETSSIYSQMSSIYSQPSSVFSPPSSVYSQLSSIYSQQSVTELPATPIDPSKARTLFPAHNKISMSSTYTAADYTAVGSVEKVEKLPWTPAPTISEKAKPYGEQTYFDGLIVVD